MALIIAHSVLDVLDLDMILPAAITLSVIIFIESVLWKKGVLPNSISNSSRGTTRYKANEYTSSSTSTPRAKTPKAKKTTKAAKPKKPKCPWARYLTVDDYLHCYCDSPYAPSPISSYRGVSNRNGVSVTGGSSRQGESGNMWKLCVNGNGMEELLLQNVIIM